MTDLSQTIAPKSDQLNADDLIGGPRTITVSRVSITSGADQPASVYFEGDGGKPYKPCKSMRRVLVRVWGSDTKAYTGRRMTLYRDDKVVFGGEQVGGIRISHMSDIAQAVTMALTVTRASRKPFTVKPLPAEKHGQGKGAPNGQRDRRAELLAAAREKARTGSDTFEQWRARLNDGQRAAVDAIEDELRDLMNEADDRPTDDADDLGFSGDEALQDMREGAR